MKNNEKLFKVIFFIVAVFVLFIIIGLLLTVYLTGEYARMPHDDKIVFMVMPFAVLFILALATLIGYLVFRDARQLGMNAWMWLLIIIIAPNGIGIVIYLIFRYNEKRRKRCPQCNYVLGDSYEICPKCGESLGSSCSECGKFVENDWKLCPYCKHSLSQ